VPLGTRSALANRDYNFAIGLAAGTLVGAGLALWLAPRLASELRERITDSARDINTRASQHYEHVSARVGDAVDALTRPRAL
jgi:gas vesicle protein